MHARTKSAILLLAVLALGIVIGVLVSGALVNRRLDRLARMRTGQGMASWIEQAVEPRSEEQRVRVREVLEAAGPRYMEIFERTRAEMETLSDSIMTELADVLSEDQMRELRHHLDMRMRRPPGRRGRDGEWRRGPPPPDGPPPERLPAASPPPP